MKKNRSLKLLGISMFIAHLIIISTGVFSPAISQTSGTGTGTITGPSCYIGATLYSGSESDGSSSEHCVTCKWSTYVFNTTTKKYEKTNHEASINYDKETCKKSSKSSSTCTEKYKIGSSCPPSQDAPPDPDPGTGA